MQQKPSKKRREIVPGLMDGQSTNFFTNVKRIIASIQAKREHGLNLGGSLNQLESMLGLDIFADDLKRDEYICGALIPTSLVNKIKRDSEVSDTDPADFVSFKHDITIYEDSGLDNEHVIIFTPDRFVVAVAK